MANTTFLLAAAIGKQTARGVINTTIRDLAGALTSADGIILGDPGSGIGESGISVGFARDLVEKAAVTGSFTLPPSNFIGRTIESLSIAFQMKGSGVTLGGSPVDSDFTPAPGVDALLECTGWSGAAYALLNGWEYSPSEVTPATVKLWFGNSSTNQAVAVVLQDVEGGWGYSGDAGTIGVYTGNLSGTYASHAVVTLPSFDYGTQGSVSAPSIEQVNFTWDVSRGFTSMSITGDNQTEDARDSNAVGGKTTRSTGRAIGISCGIYQGSADMGFELDQLGLIVAPTDAMGWLVGDVGVTGQPALAYRFEFATPELQSFTPDKEGADQVVNCELAAKSEIANGEARLIFL